MHGEQVLLRIDPEERPAHAAPEELADRAHEGSSSLLRAHAKTEAEAVAGLRQRALYLDAGVEMVASHQLQRLAADDPRSIERSGVEQHLAEPRIVHRGRDQTATAGFHDRLLEHVEELYLFAGPGIGRERLREAGGIFRAGVKARLCHLQRDKDALLEEGAKRLAADDFDEAAENVGRTAVVPLRAGLADQRKACNECGVCGIAELAAAHARLLIKLLHQSVAGVLVGD